MPIGGDHPRRWRLVVLGLALIAAGSLLLAGWAFYSRFTQTRHVWHVVICDIETATAHNSQLSATAKRQQLLFFDHLLTADVQTQPCGLVHQGRQP